MPAADTHLRLLERLTARVDKLCYVPPPWTCPDPVELARQAGIELDDWQQEMVSSQAPKLACNVSRQVGKSTGAAVLAMHTAFSEEDALVLLIAPSLRQSAELARTCKSIYAALGRPIRAVRESILSIELANRSRVIALPGTEGTIRGYAGVRLIIIDEAARVEDNTYYSVKPMLAVSGGRMVTLSTPWFERGWWYETTWHHRQDWHYFEVPAEECKRISPEFLASERESMSPLFYEQEYECKVQSAENAAFRSEDLKKIVNAETEQWVLI